MPLLYPDLLFDGHQVPRGPEEQRGIHRSRGRPFEVVGLAHPHELNGPFNLRQCFWQVRAILCDWFPGERIGTRNERYSGARSRQNAQEAQPVFLPLFKNQWCRRNRPVEGWPAFSLTDHDTVHEGLVVLGIKADSRIQYDNRSVHPRRKLRFFIHVRVIHERSSSRRRNEHRV